MPIEPSQSPDGTAAPSATASWIFDGTSVSRGRYWHWFKHPGRAWLMPVIGVLLLTAGLFLLFRESAMVATPWALMSVGIYFTFRYWIIRLCFRRHLRKTPQYGKELQWTFEENGFTARTVGSELTSDWTGFHQTYITPDGFLLYPQKGIYYWIPRSAFAEAAEAAFVERILEQKTNAKRIG